MENKKILIIAVIIVILVSLPIIMLAYTSNLSGYKKGYEAGKATVIQFNTSPILKCEKILVKDIHGVQKEVEGCDVNNNYGK